MMSEPLRLFQVFAAVMLVRGSDVLLLQRSETARFLPGVWGLPCGKLNFREDPSAAAIRELFEETGIQGGLPTLFGVSCFFGEGRNQEHHNVQLNYFLRCTSEVAVRLSSEHQDYRWIDLRQVDDFPVDEFNRAIIAQGRERAFTCNW